MPKRSFDAPPANLELRLLYRRCMVDGTVLLVDDDPDILESLGTFMESAAHVRVIRANSGPAALAALERHPVDVMLTDFRMPGMNGCELVTQARKMQPNATCLVMTAFHTLELEAQCHGMSLDILPKPLDPAAVAAKVRDALPDDSLQ